MFLKDHINEVRPEGTVNEAVQQVAFADKILLNKTDLVSKAEMKQLKETVTSINSFAEQARRARLCTRLCARLHPYSTPAPPLLHPCSTPPPRLLHASSTPPPRFLRASSTPPPRLCTATRSSHAVE